MLYISHGWKARVCAALDGKHLLGFVTKPNYDGVSEDNSKDSGSHISDADDPPKTTPAKTAEIDYDESDDDDKPQSGSDEDSSGDSDSAIKRKDLPVIRPFNRRDARQARKPLKKPKTKPLNPRERRRQEAKTKAFLMKTMDNTHVRLVKNLVTSYDIFTFICEKYEGAAFHGDPYFIQHYLMEIKYEESSDLTEFFLKLENAMKSASEATESVMTEGQKSIYLFHSMPKSWKDDLRVWKGQRKYIPYEDLKQGIEGKVRDLQAQERYTLAKGTPETTATKSERALVAAGPTITPPTHGNNYNNTCSYCDRPRHTIRHCRSLQKDLRTGHVKAGTNKGKNKRNGNSAGGNYNGNRGKNRQRQNRQERSDDDDYRRSKSRERKRYQDDSDDDDEADGNR
ncbi:hypothetical protein PHYSODRAFT_247483 [Phytophthora sojae]|uniref:CCHC-type domain-containing protein n=1 Tax=Phytophthora sojae (strain P6497) TaxID=1094619 RepID=G4Z3Z1_PHYSP|nr:hypothetical protein PHYSODRAFT_247483 [Phytophthora sojae]EGZ21543.1 hypothetical protein PHYSODRAFT_247483 [Phytophthora sojae]|eukprot:XP_009524260.1 hypothetical protein PHYSODRAFT_247483 [Phytophthora sojae]